MFDGPDARSYLDSIITNRVPAPGRMVLASMVNYNGKLIGDLTVACLGPPRAGWSMHHADRWRYPEHR